MLDWSLTQAAKAAGVGRNSIWRFEKQNASSYTTIEKLERAYLKAGVEFEGLSGVRLKD